MTALEPILAARSPLTLGGVPAGFVPLMLGDLARARGGLTVFVAADDAEMRGLADTVPFFAPEIEVIQFPAWDCLPYDRASPSLRSGSEGDARS